MQIKPQHGTRARNYIVLEQIKTTPKSRVDCAKLLDFVLQFIFSVQVGLGLVWFFETAFLALAVLELAIGLLSAKVKSVRHYPQLLDWFCSFEARYHIDPWLANHSVDRAS